MTAHLVYRRGMGLPRASVEIEVEKEMGRPASATSRRSGVAEFNERCRVSVRRYVRDWEDLTRRIGFWIDMDDAYWRWTPPHRVRLGSLKRLHSAVCSSKPTR